MATDSMAIGGQAAFLPEAAAGAARSEQAISVGLEGGQNGIKDFLSQLSKKPIWTPFPMFLTLPCLGHTVNIILTRQNPSIIPCAALT